LTDPTSENLHGDIRIAGRHIPPIAYALPLSLLCLGVYAHEPWRDEIQAWLMARDMDIPALIANAGLEGHPIGWHLLLKLFISLGLPFEVLYPLGFCFTLVAAAFLIRDTSLGTGGKILILCSPAFILLGIEARPYSLIVLLLILHARLHPRRNAFPFAYALIPGVLSQLMVLCLPYACIMAGRRLYETVCGKAGFRACLSSLPPFFLIGFALFQLIPPADKASLMLEARFAALHSDLGAVSLLSPLDLAAAFFALPFAAAWFAMLYKTDPALALCAAGSALFALFIDLCVYPLSTCHWYLLSGILVAVTLIVLNGIKNGEFPGRGGKIAALPAYPLLLACLFSYPTGAVELYKEISLPSSNLPAASLFVRNRLAGTPTAAFTMARICPLLKDMPGKQFWSPVNMRWGTFAVFDAERQKKLNMSAEQAASIILEHCPEKRPAVILSLPWEKAGESGYAAVLELSAPTVHNEVFYIYLPTEANDIRAPLPHTGE
jgi:hypothetical protein